MGIRGRRKKEQHAGVGEDDARDDEEGRALHDAGVQQRRVGERQLARQQRVVRLGRQRREVVSESAGGQ